MAEPTIRIVDARVVKVETPGTEPMTVTTDDSAQFAEDVRDELRRDGVRIVRVFDERTDQEAATRTRPAATVRVVHGELLFIHLPGGIPRLELPLKTGQDALTMAELIGAVLRRGFKRVDVIDDGSTISAAHFEALFGSDANADLNPTEEN